MSGPMPAATTLLEQRAAHLLPWLHHYNWHRLHASLGYQPPISRVPLPLNNVLGLHT
ncbi:integrase core domain-containing protein [Pseudomonas aeruginosa]|uniref:integrase core domain-containing protein n=2 Tax=Pseudomonas aeruginosa TaxID=287 RepID=UPI0033651C90